MNYEKTTGDTSIPKCINCGFLGANNYYGSYGPYCKSCLEKGFLNIENIVIEHPYNIGENADSFCFNDGDAFPPPEEFCSHHLREKENNNIRKEERERAIKIFDEYLDKLKKEVIGDI